MIDKNTLKQKYQSADAKIKKIIFSEEFGRKLEVIGESNGLNREQINLIANEVVMVLLEINNQKIFVENIEKLDIGKNISEKISKEITDQILIKEVLQTYSPQPKKETRNNVVNSFEQIILNQAKAMKPARPADESDRVTSYEVRDTSIKEEKPVNLPTENNEPKKVHDYPPNNDPYREP